MKKICIFFLSLILFIFPVENIFAASDSPSDYNVTYTIYQNATAHVDMNVSLTNQDNDSFFSSYTLQLGYSNIKNLKASDNEGTITPTVEANQKGSSVNLKFNEKIVGEGKKLVFNLSFDTNEVAQNRGNVWEINIPGILSKNDFNSFNVKVIYPASIGKPVYIKPNIAGALAKQEGNVLNFTKSDLGTSGISIAFGNYQTYSFDLTYHLKNSNLFPVKTEIAIPPETNYQEIILDDISPKPNNIKVDDDGNWLAEYLLKPSEIKNVRVLGKAKVNLVPKEEPLLDNLKENYLSEKPYWEVNDSKIKELAKELGSPYAIYQFVVKNLTYDFGRITLSKSRTGARKVLDNPKSAVCLEFTDLFIALCRAAGVPAREINGYAYARNSEERPVSLLKDVLHAWPEYYDQALNTWVMVDPTWGNTTGGIDYFFNLDVDHLAFVRKGLNSSYPVPAGGYKLSDDNKQKDVIVKLDSTFKKIETFKLLSSFDSNASSIVPLEGSVKVINIGNSIISGKRLNVSTDILTPNEQSIDINKIPPFAYTENKISYDKVPFLTNKSGIITIRLDDKVEYVNVKIAPFYLDNKIVLGGIIFALFIAILSIVIYSSRRIFISRSKEESALRGESKKS